MAVIRKLKGENSNDQFGLNGRYSVIFEKINTPRERINYNVIFKNDSTYMVCTKEIYKLSLTSQ